MDPMRGKYPRTRDLDHVQRISVPTLILVGELDRVFVPLARELHKKIRTSELKIYENTGHMLNLEAPDRFNGDIKAFLDAHSE
jgi:pimeloyl-ACP methyl ester carboxylesterase